jgi:uncharacterized protein (DUF302 family)
MSLRVAAAAVILSVFAQSALAEKLVTIESQHSVKDTVDRLAAALDQRGIKPVARVDHAAGAKTVGMELPPTEILIFGNPKLGTPLMQANPEIAIDLPLKVLAWQDKAGKVWVAYTAADALEARYGIADRDEVFKAMESALQSLTKAARGQ